MFINNKLEQKQDRAKLIYYTTYLRLSIFMAVLTKRHLQYKLSKL